MNAFLADLRRQQQQQQKSQQSPSIFANASFSRNNLNFAYLQNQLHQPQNSASQQPAQIPLQPQQQQQPQQQHQQQTEEVIEERLERDFLATLVEEVRAYRCLWDSSCRAFKELPKKQQARSQIAGKLNIEGEFFYTTYTVSTSFYDKKGGGRLTA